MVDWVRTILVSWFYLIIYVISFVKSDLNWPGIWFDKLSLETKFHLPNSRNKDLVLNGIYILPHYVIFIGKLGINQLSIFTGFPKYGWWQNFTYPSQGTKIQCIMVLWFYFIVILVFLNVMLDSNWPIFMNSLKPSWKKILVSNSRSKVLVHSGILILPIMSLLYFKIRFRLILPSPIFTVKLKFPVNNSKDKN